MERFTCCSYDSLHIAKFHSRKAIALATAFGIASFDVVIMLCLCSADNGMNEESALVFRNTAKTKKISWLPGSVQSNTSNLVLHQCHDYCGFATAVQEQCNVLTEGQNICPNKLLLCLPFQCHQMAQQETFLGFWSRALVYCLGSNHRSPQKVVPDEQQARFVCSTR